MIRNPYISLARLCFLLDYYIFSRLDTWESDTVLSDVFLPHHRRQPSCPPNTYSLLPPYLIESQFCSGWQCAQIKIQFPRLLCSERWLCDIILTNELEADLDGTFSAKLVFFWLEKMEPTQLFPFAISLSSCLAVGWVLQGGVYLTILKMKATGRKREAVPSLEQGFHSQHAQPVCDSCSRASTYLSHPPSFCSMEPNSSMHTRAQSE